MTPAAEAVLTPELEQQLREFAPDHLAQLQRIRRAAIRDGRAGASAPAAPAAVASSSSPELVIDLSTYMDKLTVGDVEDIEVATGVPTFELSFFGGRRTSVRGAAALIWVLQRKVDPGFTFAMARALPAETLWAATRAMAAQLAPKPEGAESAVPKDSASPSASE